MTQHLINTSVGTSLAVVAVPTPNVMSTITVAVIGAVSSFLTSLVCAWAWERYLHSKKKCDGKKGCKCQQPKNL